MKRIFIAAIGLTALISSCKKNKADADYQKPLVPGATVDTLIGDITSSITLTKTTYLKGIVYVRPGVTLTVNPGVTIKGSQGGTVPDPVNLANNKGTLVVEKGGKLVANGTASSPIIWTSEQTTAGSRNYGDWGGIVLLGQAPIKAVTTGNPSNTFEAFTALTNGRNDYGGTIANDNSGSMTYNRIEFAGGVVAAANREVNGLTLCGVGSGTTIHHVEVANSGDDAFEFFGGTVNVHHLLAWGTKDDDFDFDEAYAGNLQFIIAYRNDLADNSGSEIIELDNYSKSATSGPYTTPFIANATFVGPTSTVVRAGSGGRFDGGIYVREAGRIILANSLIIAQALPTAFASTPTTNDALVNPSNPTPSYVRNNIFQTAAGTNALVLDNDETNEIIDGSTTPDNNLINFLANGTNKNTALATYNDFKLGDFLDLKPGSPALTGGINLPASGIPGFVGTNARGAVIPGDVWTTAAWISVAIH